MTNRIKTCTLNWFTLDTQINSTLQTVIFRMGARAKGVFLNLLWLLITTRRHVLFDKGLLRKRKNKQTEELRNLTSETRRGLCFN